MFCMSKDGGPIGGNANKKGKGKPKHSDSMFLNNDSLFLDFNNNRLQTEMQSEVMLTPTSSNTVNWGKERLTELVEPVVTKYL